MTIIQQQAIFEALSNRRRRYTLEYLTERECDWVDMSELVDQVTALETGSAPECVDPGKRKSVYTSLRQSHLPKLEEAGFIEQDLSKNVVRLTEESGVLKRHLGLTDSSSDWWPYYLGAVVGSAIVTSTVTVGLEPVASVPPVFLVGFITVLFGIIAIAHAVLSNEHVVTGRVPNRITDLTSLRIPE